VPSRMPSRQGCAGSASIRAAGADVEPLRACDPRTAMTVRRRSVAAVLERPGVPVPDRGRSSSRRRDPARSRSGWPRRASATPTSTSATASGSARARS
jgi:hypothetical protein